SQLAPLNFERCELLFVGTKKFAQEIEKQATWRTFQKTHSARWVESVLGRGRQLNAGAENADTGCLWFLHIDSDLNQEAIEEVCNFSIQPKNEIRFFRLLFTRPAPRAIFLTELFLLLRANVLRIPFGDQGLWMPKSVFLRLGGFCESTAYGEDHLLIWKSHQLKIPVRAFRGTIETSPRKYEQNGWIKTTVLHQYLTWKQALPEFSKLLLTQGGGSTNACSGGKHRRRSKNS
ncbi:MAG: hypothetical protein KDD64_13135, partial [Bdellovibrionales bacterium]|nr:hypothetical protein [Bdellovibrionales bacterium]